MYINSLLVISLLVCGRCLVAQNLSVDKEIQKIDSLINYNQFDIIQTKINSLYKQLKNSGKQKKHKAQLLEIKFRQALILDRQDKPSVEPLRILLEIKDEAERLYTLSYRIHLLIALSYEKVGNLGLTDKYLDTAYELYKKHRLEKLYSTYCIRRSSYYKQLQELDSVFYYANKAKEYAQKYKNETDLNDSYILLSFVANRNKKYTEFLEHTLQILNYRKKVNDTLAIATSFNTLARHYRKTGDFKKALRYNDSTWMFSKSKPTLLYDPGFVKTKYEIFEDLGNIDSAYYYFKQYHEKWLQFITQEDLVKTKELEEQYQNNKKEAVIKSKNQQIFFISSLLAVIAITTLLIIRKNREISRKSKIINQQLAELSKTLEQKQVLLSELQHRVKNNLQHVISILEIQKESVDFNNIDELIRGNQNRIHSMALLHKKLNSSESVNEVDLKRYITELSELVKESYNSHKKKISLNIKCDVETMFIQKALPLGLIIVELISNSMKHAFKKRSIGIITIEISKDQNSNKLYYADNGTGFDFNKTSEKGLGQEIIKGLIDQLDGTTEINNNNGFELKIYFK